MWWSKPKPDKKMTKQEMQELVDHLSPSLIKVIDSRVSKKEMSDAEKTQFRIMESDFALRAISELSYMLTKVVVDTEKTVMGSEPMYKPVLTEENYDIVERKIMELVKKI